MKGLSEAVNTALADIDAGSYTDKAKLFDVVLAAGAVSESNYARVQSGFEGDITLPSQSLNDKLRASAAKQGIPLIAVSYTHLSAPTCARGPVRFQR